MLNPFPDLLTYSFFVPTLLRITAACVFLLLAQKIITDRKKISTISFPIVGTTPAWLLSAAGVCVAALGVLLFVGYATQWAALVGALTALKYFFLLSRYPAMKQFSRSTYALLFVICVSLLFSGAGALAMDLPL